jgi:hypothetical protein
MNKDKESTAAPAQETVHQPVAYDAEGRPLYAHPPTPAPAPVHAPTVVHVARPIEPKAQEVSPELQRLHDRSKQLYPLLNLSPGEYVISAVRRHPIGLVIPLGIGTLLIAMALSILFNLDVISVNMTVAGPVSDLAMLVVPLWIFTAIVALGMFISYYVYVNNKFFLTNESVIQEIQVSLFSRQEQTVSLSNIEDASYTQHGILQQILDYGNIRLSTEGDETTYRFSYVASPKNHIARLNNAVEAFKNGRPVGVDEN